MYRRVYKRATPSADFDTLLENATVNDRGEKEIPFNDFELSRDDFEDILDGVSKKFKLSVRERETVSFEMNLGATPKTKTE